MKNSIVSIFLILVVICGCKKQQTNYVAIMQSHTWKLVGYMNANGSVIAQEPSADTPAITFISFTNDSVCDAHMLVNEAFNHYYANNSNGSISFKLGGSTDDLGTPSAMQWDSLFVATITLVKSFSVNNTNLKLIYTGGNYMYFVTDSI
jgi:hypothetical protein